ncbi:hypothetical protein [Streptomyces sp. Tu 3180]|uniref:hypothetical protein n=1 Tax=Streptomyces sp. Tu 3180 TaxID=2682611 RepID=UPI001358480D|nr:hypothetical protein [Streptomyces sp. Tu 3180]KAF3465330.1 hypothetical protein GL259_13935 [Streptomyces sp. Tu 3180]
MGALANGVRRGARWRRPVVVAGFVAAAVGGVVACEPGGLSSAAVAYTTDQTVTEELNRRKAGVRWLSCTASFGDKEGSSSSSSSGGEDTVASVDCQGETEDGKEITVTGKVTHAVNGACVRGNITVKVDGRQRLRVDGLGDCDATSAPPVGEPTKGGPNPTVTVTVTTTVWCDRYPSCRPVEGK